MGPNQSFARILCYCNSGSVSIETMGCVPIFIIKDYISAKSTAVFSAVRNWAVAISETKVITARQMSRIKAIERTAALLLSHVKTIAAMAPALMSHPMTGNILKTPRANPELLCIRVSPKCDREVR